MTTTQVALRWAPTARLRRLSVVAGLAVVAALLSARGEVLAIAVAPLVLLVSAPRGALPRRATVTHSLEPDRCVESDEVVLTLEVLAAGCDRVDARLEPPPHSDVTAEPGPPGHCRWVVRPRRWGRHRLGPVTLTFAGGTGLYRATATTDVGEVVVYPAARAPARAVAPLELAAPLGEHPSRAVGTGVEFAGVRPYSPGDRRRDVDWRTSARHRELFVRQYAAERAFDLVLVLDTGTDAGEPGRSTLDLTVRAATGLAESYLRSHDRVGLLTFGGPLRWLGPGTGPRHRYRVVEALMSVRPDQYERAAGVVGYGLENLPARLLPHRAFVAMVTPLLDQRPLGTVRLLRARGFSPLVIDVLQSEPTARPGSPADLAVRTWRLQRAAWTVELASLGVPVVAWDGEADLTGALQHAMRSGHHRAGAR